LRGVIGTGLQANARAVAAKLAEDDGPGEVAKVVERLTK
jgi:hypothetical protein